MSAARARSRLERCAAASAAITPEQCVEEIVAEVRRWVGSDTQLQDDVTLVVTDVGERMNVSEGGRL